MSHIHQTVQTGNVLDINRAHLKILDAHAAGLRWWQLYLREASASHITARGLSGLYSNRCPIGMTCLLVFFPVCFDRWRKTSERGFLVLRKSSKVSCVVQTSWILPKLALMELKIGPNNCVKNLAKLCLQKKKYSLVALDPLLSIQFFLATEDWGFFQTLTVHLGSAMSGGTLWRLGFAGVLLIFSSTFFWFYAERRGMIWFEQSSLLTSWTVLCLLLQYLAANVVPQPFLLMSYCCMYSPVVSRVLCWGSAFSTGARATQLQFCY